MEIRNGLLYSTNNYWVALKSRLAEDEERNQQRMEKVEMVGSLSHLFSTRIYNFLFVFGDVLSVRKFFCLVCDSLGSMCIFSSARKS